MDASDVIMQHFRKSRHITSLNEYCSPKAGLAKILTHKISSQTYYETMQSITEM